MNLKAFYKPGVFAAIVFFSGNLAASGSHNHSANEEHHHTTSTSHHHFSGDPVKAMAEIIISLKHFPSKSERRQLNDIASHSDDPQVKVIAHALLNMRHTAKDQDKTNLKVIMNDKSADTNIKLLAKIIHELNHKPTRNDKQMLSQITSH